MKKSYAWLTDKYSGTGRTMNELDHYKMYIDRVDEYFLNKLNPTLKENWEQEKAELLGDVMKKNLLTPRSYYKETTC